MKTSVDARELIVLDGLNVQVRATYHKPDENSPGWNPGADRIGVVFLSGLSATRAAHGDAAVYWADSFAKLGYPSFRLDLPGYGDSDGNPPPEWLDFITKGGYASIASAKMAELTARYNLSGLVLAGHCAGAVSALFIAAASRECKGLLLLDPYFHIPPRLSAKIRQQIHFWSIQSRLGAALRATYELLKSIRLSLRGKGLPENANVSLLGLWKDLTSSGLPVLILQAPVRKSAGLTSKVGEFDYLDYCLKLAGRRSQVIVKLMGDANHSFANQLGRVAVRQEAEVWLNTYFPLTHRGDSGVEHLLEVSEIHGIEYEHPERCVGTDTSLQY